MNDITTIIFDMDGVIINSEPIYLEIISRIYDKIGADVPEEIQLQTIGRDGREWYTYILENFEHEGNPTVEELFKMERDGMTNYLNEELSEKDYFPGLKEVIKTLKDNNIKLGLASASHYDLINRVLGFYGVDKYFDYIVSSGDPKIKKGKPEPDIFLNAMESLGATPEECLIIEDSENGLKAAKRAGIESAAFLSCPAPIDPKDATYIFDDYKDFFKNIKPLNKLDTNN